MAALTFTRENVVATFPDFAEIYDAVMALELSGIDGGDIRVVGEGAERAAELAASEVAVVDVQSFRRLIPRMTAGALIGGLVGAAVGLLTIVLVDDESGTAAVGAVLGFVVLCAATGGLVGLFTRLGTGPAWDLSLVPRPGCASIVVSSSDPQVLDRAEAVLRRCRAATVARLDERARPVRQ